MEIVESNTSSYDYTVGWFQLINVLHDATPIVIKYIIPEGELGTGATTDFVDETDDDIRYSQKLHCYLRKKECPSEEDQTFVDNTPSNVFLKKIDLPRLRRFLKKFFPEKWMRKKEAINVVIGIRNALIHEGKLTVQEEDEFQYYETRLEDCLTELGVSQEEIKDFKSVVIDPKMFKNIIDAEKQGRENLKKYNIMLEKVLTEMGKQNRRILKDIEPIKASSPFKSMSIKLTEVFKQGGKHPDYGEHYQCLDNNVYYVDHEDFLIGTKNQKGRVYLGYHELQWIALKSVITTGGRKPNELDIMIKLGAHDSKHKNVIGVKKAFSDNKSLYYLVMELCDYNLDTYITRELPLSAQERCDIAKQLLDSITFLHYEKGEKESIVHRDLKPNNVLIKTFDDPEKVELKLADYGMSVVRSNAEITPAAKGLSAWKWYAPGSSESENSPVWYENDVFVTNSLLAFILSSNHLHPFCRDHDLERDLMTRYKNSEKIRKELKLDTHENVRDFLNQNFKNYFEFFDIKEVKRRSQNESGDNKSVVTKSHINREKELKEKLQIGKIRDGFMELNPVKNPNNTEGERDDMNPKYQEAPTEEKAIDGAADTTPILTELGNLKLSG